MKNPRYLQYTCTRCKKEMTDDDDVMILEERLLLHKKIIDLCSQCRKDFKTFMENK